MNNALGLMPPRSLFSALFEQFVGLVEVLRKFFLCKGYFRQTLPFSGGCPLRYNVPHVVVGSTVSVIGIQNGLVRIGQRIGR